MLLRNVTVSFLVAVLVSISCRSGVEYPQPAVVDADRGIQLHVRNDNFYDATLYAVSPGGVRRRIGRVSGKSQETFEFRWTSTEIRIEIALQSVGSTLTDALPVDEDDTLDLVIESDLHHRIPSEVTR